MADDALISRLLAQWEEAREQGSSLAAEMLCEQHPQLLGELREKIAALRAFDSYLTSNVDPSSAEQTAPWHSSPSVTAPQVPGYQIVGELGRGGMGVVFQARQLALNRLVALKMIRAGELAGYDDRARFLAEAEAVAQLQHANIVQIFEIGEHAGQPFFSLEFVAGGSLDRKTGGKPMAPRDAARFIEIVARAMHYAHRRGIVHRDLKPANILLTPDGVPKIVDFGLAKRVDDDSQRTLAGTILGTPSFMAPEQAQGNSSAIGPPADIYALGALLYDLLTGRPPFRADSAWETVRQVVEQEPVAPSVLQPGVPRDLEIICLKCLHKDIGRRYASAWELADELDRFLRDEPIQARPAGRVEKTWRWCRRNPRLAIAGSMAATALLAVAVISVLFNWHAQQAAHDLAQALAQTQERLAVNDLERGLRHAEDGDAHLGLLWLARSLQEAPPESTALVNRIRTQLDGWTQGLYQLERVVAHPQPMNAAASHPQGNVFVTASDVTVQAWEAGAKRGPALEHPAVVTAVAFSPNGDILATAAEDGVVRCWDWKRGELLEPILKHPYVIASLAFHADGVRLLTGGVNLKNFQGLAQLWDRKTGKTIGELFMVGDPVWDVGYLPGSDTWAIASGNVLARTPSDVQLWDPQESKVVGRLPHPGPVQALAISHSGKWIATGDWDGRVRFWDVLGRKLLHTTFAHEGSIRALAFNRTDKEIAAGSSDRSARVWSVETGRPISPPLRHQGTVQGVAFSSDGQALLSAGQDGTARFWSIPGAQGFQHDGVVDAVAFSPDGKLFVTAGRDAVARLWSVESRKPYGAPLRHKGLIHAVAFSPDGEWVATGSADRTARVWHGANGQPAGPPLPHDGFIAALDIDPRSQTLATACHDSKVRLWNVTTGKLRTAPLAHPKQVNHLAFHPKGGLMATACNDGAARLWDVATGALHGELLRMGNRVVQVRFSPDGALIAAASDDGTARLWGTAKGQPLVHSLRHDGPLTSLAFSPRGDWLVTGSADRSARVWDMHAGKSATLHLPHQNVVVAVACSPDGACILTGSVDGTARLWDATTGQMLGAPFRHRGPIRALAFSPDSRLILTSGVDQTARLWERPRPLAGEPMGLARRIESHSGLELVTGQAFRVLDADEWQLRQ